MQVGGKVMDARRNSTDTIARFNGRGRRINDGQWISACASGRIKSGHLSVCERKRSAEPFAKKLVNESHLSFHYLDRSEIHASCFTKVRVVRLKEMLVEIQPRVSIGTEFTRVDDSDSALK